MHYRQQNRTKRREEETKNGWVLDTTLFCLDKDRNIFVGAVNIRHYLNDELLKTGGHIGDGIRPSEKKGYAKSIINNGGVLENEVEEDGHIEQRYWIQL